MMKNSEGFTLLELVIVIFIVGVLSSVAKPYYIEYRTKAERQKAQTELLQLVDYYKSYRAVNGSYDGATPPKINSNFYTFTATSTSNLYLLRATPINTTTQKDDGVLCLNQNGFKARQPRAGVNCGGLTKDTTW